MPTRHLFDDQRRSFARFSGDPAPEQLARFFHLDGTDREVIGELRGEHNRLGFAAMLTGVRFLGVFPGAADDVPCSVLETLREQLGLGQAVSLDGYFEGRSRVRHLAVIRGRFGFTDFGEDARALSPDPLALRAVLERRRSARTTDRPGRRLAHRQ